MQVYETYRGMPFCLFTTMRKIGRKIEGMEVLDFDVMCDGKYITSMRYPYCRLFVIKEDELRKYIESYLPTLKGKNYHIEY